MLIVALIGAFVLYAALYLVFEAAQPQLAAVPLAQQLQDMLFRLPQSTPLALLKVGIVAFLFYLIGDALVSTVRRKRKSG